MRPGQLHPNELELAILTRIATTAPSIRGSMQALHVRSREFTGAGSVTNFRVNESLAGAREQRLGLDALINVPGVPNGLGAVLFCKGDQPACLEIYTYGDDHWDGTYTGLPSSRLPNAALQLTSRGLVVARLRARLHLNEPLTSERGRWIDSVLETPVVHMVDVQRARRQAASIAANVLAGRVSAVIGAIDLNRLRPSLDVPDDDLEFETFLLIDSECEALPIGPVRQYWSAEALDRKAPDVARAEQWALETGRQAFQMIVERFGATT